MKNKAAKTALICAGSLAGLVLVIIVAIQIILTPKMTTSLLNRYVPRFMDADFSCAFARASMFRHFPDLTLKLEDVCVSYPHSRFDSLETGSRLMEKGRGERNDTLACFKKFVVAVNVPEFLSGKINVPVLLLEGPHLYAKAYNDSTYNWNIFASAGSDEPGDSSGVQKPLPDIRVRRVRIQDDASVVYCALQDSISASFRMRTLAFKGDVCTSDLAGARGRFKLDTLRIGLRTKSDTLSLRLGNFRVAGDRDGFRVRSEAKASARTALYGRIRIPVSIEGAFAMPQTDSIPTLEVKDFNLNFGGIPLNAGGRIGFLPENRGISLDVRARIDSCDVDALIDNYIVRIVEDAAQFRSGSVLNLDMSATSRPGGELDADLKGLYLDSDFAKLNLSGSVSDVLGADPSFSLKGEISASARNLLRFLPDSLGINAAGGVKAEIDASLRLSQLSVSQIANADISAKILSDSLRLEIPSDSIRAFVSSFEASAGTKGARGGRILAKDERILTVSILADSLDASLPSLEARASDLSVKAFNSADILDSKSTNVVHPFSGTLSAGILSLRDSDNLALVVRDTKENFSIRPYGGDRSIPEISVRSRTGRAFLRSQMGRFSIKDLSLNVSAANVDYRTANAGKAGKHSAARTGRPRPASQGKPEWLQDESLRVGDLSFSLTDEVAKYFREWNLRGKISLGTARLMTPYFPLRTSVRSLDGAFDNDSVSLSDFSLRSGESNLHLEAGLKGLRRTLLGKGFIEADVNISSNSLDVNELLAAYSQGSQYRPRNSPAAESIDDDEQYQKAIEQSAARANPDSSALVIVPANLVAQINLNASNARYSDLKIDTLYVKAIAKERCLQIDDFNAFSSVGNIALDAFYSTVTRDNVKTGFSLRLSEITARDVIGLIPAVDEAIPMLKHFSGLLDCSLAATASLDDHMNILVPSLDGVIRISGNDLAIRNSEEFTRIAKLLLFKDTKKAVIDNLSVEGLVKNSKVEVFPFLLDVDRYDLALAGMQNVATGDFYYHVSILNSPLPVRFGVDLRGASGKKSKLSVCKVKYRDVHSVPVFTEVVEQSSVNLLESIRNIFQKGVDVAVQENEANKGLNDYKRSKRYVPADEIRSEGLDEKSRSTLESLSSGSNASSANTQKEGQE